MSEDTESLKISIRTKARDHLSNERTFLSWVRTSLGVMAFGFVIEKFTLFTNEIVALLGKTNLPLPALTHSSLAAYSSAFGEGVVALGLVICLLSFAKYRKTEKQIEANTYRASITLDVLLTLSILLIGAYLLVYLKLSI